MSAAVARYPLGKMAATRRRKIIGHRRRVEDEGEDDGGHEHLELEDDSLTEGSISDDNDLADDSDTSNIDEASPTSPNLKKSAGNGAAKSGRAQQQPAAPATTDPTNDKSISDTDMMLHGLSISDQAPLPQETHFDDAASTITRASAAPVIVSSSSAARQPEVVGDRRRREHEEYRRKRDEDPAFVPNRGAFFMHDHRHAGPSANGFRPFGRPRGGGSRGRGGFGGGSFAPVQYVCSIPSTDSSTTLAC
jgi:hypothetical protein